ncbi:MAG: cofactor-independent phosphoglycerate mutase [Syntrophobacterales bacterium]|jgi:2,3-bisphosphoglycerate-independent phosphoglycerate mutase|nr:cofactor-independent phosphoglycerate mutase [Syntrophobacterales bacterium]
MKYVVIIGDGMADFPITELQGKTPLMVARKPYMDMMAKGGVCGKVVTIPDGMLPGSDVAGMSIFGYNPSLYYTGRAPIEAVGMGIAMEDEDVAFRCNLVHLEERSGKVLMGDYGSGHISTEEAHLLVDLLNKEIGSDKFNFFPGVSYRHIMLWRKGSYNMDTTPPHDITAQEIVAYMPKGEGSEILTNMMERSRKILSASPVNKAREKSGKVSANSIWLWGQGKKSHLPSFKEKYGLTGATVAAVDLIKGISGLVGFEAPLVNGATGYLDTDYGAKARKALELLKNHDIVYIHVEAPDEASHNGNIKEKIKAVELIDQEIVGRIFEETGDGVKFLIVTDHATPISLKTHHACPVPFAIFNKKSKQPGCRFGYDERTGDKVLNGEELIAFFLKGRDL